VHAQPAGKRWAWPRTLQEAKPKAGAVAAKQTVDGDLIDTWRHGPTAGAKPRSRIESANVRVGRLSDLSYLQSGGTTAPTKNIGQRTRIDQLARGPGRAEMLADADGPTKHAGIRDADDERDRKRGSRPN
jgi:hypothetical protein